MIKYLSIILIYNFLTINTASSQMITIYPSGIKNMTLKRTMAESSTTDNFYNTEKSDSNHRISSLKTTAHSKPDLKPAKNLSAPLLKRLFVTSDFGERYNPVLHGKDFHAGIDLRAYYDTVLSIAGGIILKEGFSLKAGNFLIIQHGNRIKSIYCHLSSFLLEPGDKVIAGSKVAISGATGSVTGPHLHFAIKAEGKFTDPMSLIIAIEQLDRKVNY